MMEHGGSDGPHSPLISLGNWLMQARRFARATRRVLTLGTNVRINPKLLNLIVWTLLALAALPQNLLDDPDVFWHIKTGNLILAHGWPREDVFSYSVAGQPWIDQEWLAQVFYALTYNVGGWIAVQALAIALIATTFTIIFCHIKTEGHVYGALLVAVVALWFAATHFSARPHLFGMLCLA